MPALTGPLFCVCWSCDGMCGGSSDPNSCGPTTVDVDGRHVCESCRANADVIGADFVGAQATVSQDRVRLSVDTFGPPASVWLTAAGAREMARVLTERAAQLEQGDPS
jgi:hypothetical protein